MLQDMLSFFVVQTQMGLQSQAQLGVQSQRSVLQKQTTHEITLRLADISVGKLKKRRIAWRPKRDRAELGKFEARRESNPISQRRVACGPRIHGTADEQGPLRKTRRPRGDDGGLIKPFHVGPALELILTVRSP